MWEYSALFDMPGPTALEVAMREPDWWKREGCDLRVGQMAYRTTTTLAGDILVAEIYPAWGREKKRKVRKANRNLTPERIQKYNEQRARFRLELLMDNNFTADDLNMTLTYTDAPTEAEARKDVKNYIARLKRERKRRGLPEMKYVYALEDERDGRKKQLHCHLVMSGGISRKDAEKIWRKGSAARGFANCDELQPDKEGLRETRVLYLRSEPRERNGQRKAPLFLLEEPDRTEIPVQHEPRREREGPEDGAGL